MDADRSVDQNMAYLNCPFCPFQAVLVRDAEHSDIPPLEKYRCPAKHVFYVEVEDKKIQEYLDRGIEPRDI
ncbi:MAG: hypothetical protein ABSE80_13675 [Halobacteriota archaeon]